MTGMQKCMGESIVTEMGLRRNTLDSVALTTTELKSVLKTSVNFEWRNISSKVLERLQFSSGSRTFDTIIVYRNFSINIQFDRSKWTVRREHNSNLFWTVMT